MAQLPVIQRQGVAATSQGTAAEAQTRYFGQVGQQLQQTGAQIDQLGDEVLQRHLQLQAQTDEAAASDAGLQWRDDARAKMSPLDGYLSVRGGKAVGIADQAGKDLHTLADKYAAGLSNTRQKQLFYHSIGLALEDNISHVADHEATQRDQFWAETSKAVIDSSIEDAVANAGDPQAQQLYKERLHDQILSTGQQLGLPAQAIQFQLDQAQSKVHAGTISALAYDNPRAASNYMDSHKSEILGTDRLQLEQQIDASRRRIMAEQEHAVIMQDRADRLKAETVTKDLDGKLADGTLTRGEVDQQKDTLDESHYRYFVETLAKGGAGVEAKDMPEVAGPLFSRWVAGENVDGDANAAYRLGHISFETYRTITQREKSPAVQRGYEVIKATVGASALNATPDAQSALVLGNKDFAEWLRGHPSATDVEIADTARYFGNHYRATEAGKYRSNMPAPRYLVGAISGTPQQINLWETVRRANEAHARGELTDEQYADEAMRIQNVRDVIMRESGGVDDEGNPRTPYDPLGPNAPGYIAPPPTHPHTPTPNRLAVPGVPGATIGGTGTTVYGRIH